MYSILGWFLLFGNIRQISEEELTEEYYLCNNVPRNEIEPRIKRRFIKQRYNNIKYQKDKNNTNHVDNAIILKDEPLRFNE